MMEVSGVARIMKLSVGVEGKKFTFVSSDTRKSGERSERGLLHLRRCFGANEVDVMSGRVCDMDSDEEMHRFRRAYTA